MDFSIGRHEFFPRRRLSLPLVFIEQIEIGDRRAIKGRSMHSTCRPTYAALTRRCVGRQVRRSSRPWHARPRASHGANAVPAALRGVEPRQQRREGAGEPRPLLCRGRGRAGRLCTTRSTCGTIVRPIPRPPTAQGRSCAIQWQICLPLILATKHGVDARRPGPTTVAAPIGWPQRRPVRALARWRRLGTTRSGARASEERENEERHAV